MANDLTGDYDVVAAFSLGAVDRILAAMHRGKRFPHSLSMAVDDRPDLRLGASVVSIVDIHGEAVSDADRVKKAAYSRPITSGLLLQEVLRNIDPVVNWCPDPGPRENRSGPSGEDDAIDSGVLPPAHSGEDFSFLSGVAQLQLGAPRIQLPSDRSDRADLHMPAMIRYRADDRTRPLSAAMRGEIVTTFGVRQTSSAAGTNIVVDVAGGGEGSVRFVPLWTASSLDADDRKALDKALANAVKRGLQPSSTPTPAKVRTMHFKGFGDAVAVMMNIATAGNPSPASVASVPVRAEDHFVLTVNGDSITRLLAEAVNAAIAPNRFQQTDTAVKIDHTFGADTFYISTSTTVLPATVQLMDTPLFDKSGVPGRGQILLSIPVQVRFGWKDKPFFVPDPKDFDFTIMQAFTLTLHGRHVGLQRLGDVAVNIPGDVPDNERNPAREKAKQLFKQAWNSQESAIQRQINKALSTDGLQSFLKSLMNPVGAGKGDQVEPDLAYTYFEVRPAGILLRGALAVPPWPLPHVEFDKDPWAPPARPEYRALKSWIPGGAIEQYHWHYSSAITVDDKNEFVTINAPALVPASNRICLSFSGLRITASGPIAYEPVDAASRCKWTSLPLAVFKEQVNLSAGNRPRVAVVKPGQPQEGILEVVAHTSLWAPKGLGGGTANLLVHFPDDRSAGHLESLTYAVGQSGRVDTETAIVCVLTGDQLRRVRGAGGLIYADDAAGWERLLDVSRRPATVIVDPSGKVVWREYGESPDGELSLVLRKYLAPGGQFFPQFVESVLRMGELSPNFVFEPEPRERLTLRKLTGRPVTLVFCKGDSGPCMATLANLLQAFAQRGSDAPLLLAIADGEDGERVRESVGRQCAAIVVPDPARQISTAYGIRMWPTTVSLDRQGLVQEVRFEAISGRELELSVADRRAECDSRAAEA